MRTAVEAQHRSCVGYAKFFKRIAHIALKLASADTRILRIEVLHRLRCFSDRWIEVVEQGKARNQNDRVFLPAEVLHFVGYGARECEGRVVASGAGEEEMRFEVRRLARGGDRYFRRCA